MMQISKLDENCLLAVGKGIIKEDSNNNLFWNVQKKFSIYSLNIE